MREMVSLETRAVDVIEVRRDLAGGQPLRRERQHDVIHPGQPSLALAYEGRSETGVGVSWDLDLDRHVLGEQRFRPSAVAGVPARAPGRVVIVVAQVLGHLRFQGGSSTFLVR